MSEKRFSDVMTGGINTQPRHNTEMKIRINQNGQAVPEKTEQIESGAFVEYGSPSDAGMA